MLKVENVTKKFDNYKAINHISFSIKIGEVVALLGENGAGKSTLLRVISGFICANEGKVSFNGIDLEENRLEFLKNIGYVQEISSLYEDMTVLEFLKFVANIREIQLNLIEEKIKEVIDLLDIKDVATKNMGTLSKGYKKRVELAAGLIAEPKLLLLDEPTEGLDPNQKYSIRNIIKKYAKKHIVIVSTHTMEDVECLANRVLLLHKGCLKFDNYLSEFKKISNNNLIKSFRKVTMD